MEKGHVSLRRGVSWSPGGVRKPLPSTQDLDGPGTECNASWEKRGYKGQPTSSPGTNQIGCKTNLTRSASLSEKELKEARVRSQIIAAQLTIPSNSNSSSRGVQLFNRRRQRVNAFTLESCGEKKSGEVTAEHVETGPPCNSLTWAERSSEEKDRDLTCKNSVAKPPWSPPVRARRVGDIMEDPGEHIHEVEDIKETIVQERHFLPVNEKEELEEEEEEELVEEVNIGKEEEKDEFHAELDIKVADERTCEGGDAGAAPFEPVCSGVPNGAYSQPAPSEKLSNGCHSDTGPQRVSVSISKPTPTFMNRTARPFFSPTPVQTSGAASPDMDLPAPPAYSTPRLPTFTRPVAFSPPPPPPSYPTPPLPTFSGQPPQSYSSPPPMSPVMSSPPVSQFPLTAPPVPQYIPPNPPVPHYGPPAMPRPSTFVPQSSGARSAPIKTGILEESAAKRTNRKAMFTFKEKPVVAPNPELLSMVQGADEKRKHGNRSVPEPASEEELLALGAEASNFLAEEVRAEEVKAPEWATSLRSSMTRQRADHKPEQTLTNASGKGAELFARRQSRMEKYVLENQNAGQMRSPSPTMSLPPSWVYPSNMPGRVKALAKNSDMCAQLSENMKAQQSTKRKPVKKPPPTAPVPEPPPLENGCTKIEMDLSRHQPYQLNSSLFILNPVKDPMSSLPRAAPPPKPVVTVQSFSRQASLPSNSPSQFTPYASHAHCMSPQLSLSHTGGMDYPPNYGPVSASEQPRITSPVSAFSPERVASPRSGVQAPRPTFSAKKAGIAPQSQKESSTPSVPSQTSTPNRTPNFPRRFSSPEGPSFATWSPSPQTNQSASNVSSSRPPGTSPVPPPGGSRCQSPAVGQTAQSPTVISTSTSRPPRTSTAASPVSPLWGSRCQSPMVCQPSQPSSTAKPLYTSTVASPVSLPREARCMSPNVNSLDSKANHRLLAKNIINAAKRKNSPSPGALSGHGLPISPLGGSHHGYDCNKPPFSPSPLRALSPPFTSPPPTPTQMIGSPVRLYNTRSLTDSDASVESEDSGLRSPGLRSYNTCPRGWGGSLRVKRGSSVSTDL